MDFKYLEEECEEEKPLIGKKAKKIIGIVVLSLLVVEADACSNFYQTPGLYYGMGLDGPCPRYAKLLEGYEEYNGKITEDEMMNVMASASQKYFHHNNTQWTVVFNTKDLTATYCYFEDFETKYHFDLKD